MTFHENRYRVRAFLLRLGARPDLCGFQYAEYGILLALEKEERLLAVTKEIYLEIGLHYHVSWNAAERSLRILVDRIWRQNGEGLSSELGYPFLKKPTVGEFLAVVTMNLKE